VSRRRTLDRASFSSNVLPSKIIILDRTDNFSTLKLRTRKIRKRSAGGARQTIFFLAQSFTTGWGSIRAETAEARQSKPPEGGVSRIVSYPFPSSQRERLG